MFKAFRRNTFNIKSICVEDDGEPLRASVIFAERGGPLLCIT